MNNWHDRNGKPFPGTDAKTGSAKWTKAMDKISKLLNDPDYRFVKQEYTPKGKYWVSTAWLGIDHDLGHDLTKPNPHPVIFETMVFQQKWSIPEQIAHVVKTAASKLPGRYWYHRNDTPEQQRYSTEKQALKGHKALLKEYTDKE